MREEFCCTKAKRYAGFGVASTPSEPYTRDLPSHFRSHVCSDANKMDKARHINHPVPQRTCNSTPLNASNIRRFYVSQLSVDCPGVGREGPRTIAHHEHPACTYAHSEWIHESSGGARPDSRERGERNVVEWDFGKHDIEFMRSRGWLD